MQCRRVEVATQAAEKARKMADQKNAQQQALASTYRKEVEHLKQENRELSEKFKLTGTSPVVLSEALGVSPNSMKKVQIASKRGSLASTLLPDADSADGERNQFNERVINQLLPALKKICSLPTYMVSQHSVLARTHALL